MRLIGFAGVLACLGIAELSAATTKAEKAEWVQRCDRLKDDKRFACLDELRAEAHKRFAQGSGVTPGEKPLKREEKESEPLQPQKAPTKS